MPRDFKVDTGSTFTHFKKAFSRFREKLKEDVAFITRFMYSNVDNNLKEEKVKDLITGFKYHTMMDEKVCKRCGPLHGMVFPSFDTAHRPPLHPNCRCWVEEPVYFHLLTMNIEEKKGEVVFQQLEGSKDLEFGDGTIPPQAVFRRSVYEGFSLFYAKLSAALKRFFGRLH